MSDQLYLFDAENPEDEKKKKDERVERPKTEEGFRATATYWQHALEVVNAWAHYQKVKKLHINATHEETWKRVRPVIVDEKYYKGSIRRVEAQKQALSRRLDDLLTEFFGVCALYGVQSVDRDWLYDNLKEAKDYASYRGKCQRRLKKESPAVSLKDLGARQARKRK